MPAPLSADQAEIVEARWRAGAGGTRNRRLQGFGCVTAFVGMAALTLTPALGAWRTMDPGAAYLVLGVAVVFLVGGAALGLLGGTRAGSADRAAIDRAASDLLRAAGGAAEPVEEVTLLLLRLQAAGPGAVPPDLPARLAPVAELIHRVEAHLVRRRLVPPPPSSTPERP